MKKVKLLYYDYGYGDLEVIGIANDNKGVRKIMRETIQDKYEYAKSLNINPIEKTFRLYTNVRKGVIIKEVEINKCYKNIIYTNESNE